MVYRAYEIKRFWKRDPPPVEILEKLTAKGGDILSRTVENFQPPRSSMANGDSDTGGEEARTPKDEKMDIDEPGSGAGGRSTRGELSTCPIYLCVVLIQYSKAFGKLRPHDSFSNRMYPLQDKHATHLVTYSPLNQPRRPTLVTTMRRRIQTVRPLQSQTTNRDPRCL